MGRPAMNTIEGTVTDGIFRAGNIACPVERPDGPVTLGIRPEQVELVEAGSEGAITLAVDVRELIEPDTLLIFQTRAGAFTVRTQKNCDHIEVGQPVGLRFPREALHYFDASTGERLR
jgi:ABC-type sugar transport system ATPase subunit